VAAKFGVTQAQIVKYNYLVEGEWLNEGQKIAINGYAPRNWDVIPGESSAPSAWESWWTGSWTDNISSIAATYSSSPTWKPA
jgi:hypothetical protein